MSISLDNIQRQVDECVVHGGIYPTCLLVPKDLWEDLNLMSLFNGRAYIIFNGIGVIHSIDQAIKNDCVLEIR